MCIPPIIANQRLSKRFPVAMNTHATIEEFYMNYCHLATLVKTV
jgi:hypothetical protein